jgi:hypothetical protein
VEIERRMGQKKKAEEDNTGQQLLVTEHEGMNVMVRGENT